MTRLKKTICKSLIVALMIPQVLVCSASAVEAAGGTWKQSNRGWWYSYSDGSYAKSTWLQDGGKWYYFDSKGYMVTGWKQIGGKWYFFDNYGKMATGWKQIGKKWYFFNTSGVMQTGWKQIKGKWYFFNSSGIMFTGWKEEIRYGNKGTQFEYSYSVWYFFDSSGIMQTGWTKIGGKWYYFASDGTMVQSQYNYLIGGKRYCFDKNGVMITGTWENDWFSVYFDQNGLWDGKVNGSPIVYKDLKSSYTIVKTEISGCAWSQDGITLTNEMKKKLVPGSVIDITFTSGNGEMWVVLPYAEYGWVRIGVGINDGSLNGFSAYKGNHCQISYETIARILGNDVSKWGDILQFESNSDWKVSSVVIGMTK